MCRKTNLMGCDSCICRPLPKLADITLLLSMRMRCCCKSAFAPESLRSLASKAVLRTIFESVSI